jgi:PAS domain S-box-containing protein
MLWLDVDPVTADKAILQKDKIFSNLVWSTAVFITIMMMAACVLIPMHLSRWLTILSAIDLLSFGVLFLNKKGRTRLAAYIFIIFLVIGSFILGWTGGGITTPAVQFLSIIVLMAGLTLGWKEGLVVGLIGIAGAMGLVLAKRFGILTSTVIILKPPAVWLIFTVFLTILMILQYVTVRVLDKALHTTNEEVIIRKEAEERYRLIAENVSDIIWVYNISHGRFTYSSYSFHPIRGSTSNKADKQDWGDKIKPDGLETIIEKYEDLIEKYGENYNFGTSLDTLQIKSKDGEYFWAEVSTRLQKNVDGDIEIFGVTRNIEDRKRAENQLEESKKLLSAIVNSTDDFIWSVDASNFGLLTFNNSLQSHFAQTLGIKIKKGMLPNEILPTKKLADKWINLYEEALSRGNYSTEIKMDLGEGCLYLTLNSLIKDGRVYAISAFAENITERKHYENGLIAARIKAEEMNRLKSNFLANMSHELRTPMIGINGLADILRRDLSEPKFKEMAENIYSSGSRLMETLNLILDLSKIETEKLDLHFEEIDLIKEAESVIKLFTGIAVKKGLSLTKNFNSSTIAANIDVRVFRTIMNNLISNAIKFTHAGGIKIKLKKIDQVVEIKVIDTGIGIEKSNHDIIFDEFRQVSEGFNRNFEGTGLGLSVTKKFVEKFGGKINVESEFGKGSTFTVTLPCVSDKIVV